MQLTHTQTLSFFIILSPQCDWEEGGIRTAHSLTQRSDTVLFEVESVFGADVNFTLQSWGVARPISKVVYSQMLGKGGDGGGVKIVSGVSVREGELARMTESGQGAEQRTLTLSRNIVTP